MTVTTIDPSTAQPLATYEETTPAEFGALLDRAIEAARAWRDTPPEQRTAAVGQLAGVLRERAGKLALLATREMGKPLAESRAEVEKCAWACDWYADHAPEMLRSEPADTGALRSRVIYTPLGVLLAIMPWNFPYWQVIRALAPVLAAGNVVVLKHAPSTTGCALALAGAVRAAGLPEGVLSVLVVSAERTGEVMPGVIGDDRIAAVTLTGGLRGPAGLSPRLRGGR